MITVVFGVPDDDADVGDVVGAAAVDEGAADEGVTEVLFRPCARPLPATAISITTCHIAPPP